MNDELKIFALYLEMADCMDGPAIEYANEASVDAFLKQILKKNIAL